MVYLNYFLCIVFFIGICYNLYLFITRKKQILVPGKEDFFTIAIILFFCIILLESTPQTTVVELVRNIFIYVFIFSMFPLKRGISEKGMITITRTIPWDKIKEIEVSEYQSAKICVMLYTENYKHKMLFSIKYLKPLMRELSKYHSENIKIEKKLNQMIMTNKI